MGYWFIVCAEERDFDAFLLVEFDVLDEIVRVGLSPVGSAVAASDAADEAAITVGAYSLHAARRTPCICVDEQVRIILQCCLG